MASSIVRKRSLLSRRKCNPRECPSGSLRLPAAASWKSFRNKEMTPVVPNIKQLLHAWHCKLTVSPCTWLIYLLLTQQLCKVVCGDLSSTRLLSPSPWSNTRAVETTSFHFTQTLKSKAAAVLCLYHKYCQWVVSFISEVDSLALWKWSAVSYTHINIAMKLYPEKSYNFVSQY